MGLVLLVLETDLINSYFVVKKRFFFPLMKVLREKVEDGFKQTFSLTSDISNYFIN